MTIQEFAEFHNLSLIYEYRFGVYLASLQDCTIYGLKGVAVGYGDTPEASLKCLCETLSGKKIVYKGERGDTFIEVPRLR